MENILSKSIIFKMAQAHGRMPFYILSYIIRNNIDRYPSYNGLLGYCRNKIFR